MLNGIALNAWVEIQRIELTAWQLGGIERSGEFTPVHRVLPRLRMEFRDLADYSHLGLMHLFMPPIGKSFLATRLPDLHLGAFLANRRQESRQQRLRELLASRRPLITQLADAVFENAISDNDGREENASTVRAISQIVRLFRVAALGVRPEQAWLFVDPNGESGSPEFWSSRMNRVLSLFPGIADDANNAAREPGSGGVAQVRTATFANGLTLGNASHLECRLQDWAAIGDEVIGQLALRMCDNGVDVMAVTGNVIIAAIPNDGREHERWWQYVSGFVAWFFAQCIPGELGLPTPTVEIAITDDLAPFMNHERELNSD